jgi:hypothetical protein
LEKGRVYSRPEGAHVKNFLKLLMDLLLIWKIIVIAFNELVDLLSDAWAASLSIDGVD